MSPAQTAFFQFILSMKRIACPGNGREAFRFNGLARDLAYTVSSALNAANRCEHLKDCILRRACGNERKTILRFLRGRFGQIIDFGTRSFAGRAVASHETIAFLAEPLVMLAPPCWSFEMTMIP